MRRRLDGERGSVSLLVVIMVPALLAAAGLVLDGGRQLHARRDAQSAAQAAARAAVQPDDAELLSGELDADAAIGRAQAMLALHGVSGTVAVDAGAVVVTVTESVDYLILPGGATVSERASTTGVRVDGAPG